MLEWGDLQLTKSWHPSAQAAQQSSRVMTSSRGRVNNWLGQGGQASQQQDRRLVEVGSSMARKSGDSGCGKHGDSSHGECSDLER